MIEVELLAKPDSQQRAALAEFARSCANTAYQQQPIWPQVVPPHHRHSYYYALCRRDNQVVAASVIRRSPLVGPYWLATSQRGPLVNSVEDLAAIIPHLGRALANQGACTWQFSPRMPASDLPRVAHVLREAGAQPLPPDRQSLHVATGVVNLTNSEDALLAGFSQGGRRKLKQARKAGVTVRRVEDAADVKIFQRAMTIFEHNRPDYSMSGIPNAEGQCRLVGAIGGGMLLAEREGLLLGGASFVRQGNEAIWMTLATTDAEPKIPSNSLLLWEAMLWAREQGCEGYDLAGLPLEEPTDAGEASRMQFKSAFRPQKRVLMPMHGLALKPLAHNILFTARQAVRAIRA